MTAFATKPKARRVWDVADDSEALGSQRDIASGPVFPDHLASSPSQPLSSATATELYGHYAEPSSSGGGAPLPYAVLRKFESSLGADLSSVRVHTGDESAASANAVGARAYTIGQDIHFGAAQYDPSGTGGEHLLAHEVAHTLQQRATPARAQFKRELSSPGDLAEHEADGAADAMVRGAKASVSPQASANGTILRKPKAAAAAKPAAAAKYQLHGTTLPPSALTISGSTEGLAAKVIGTGAFKDVPPSDPLFATIDAFCSPNTWQKPNQSKTQSVSASSWGRKGAWNIKVTPTLFGPPAYVAPGGKLKAGTSDSTATTFGGTTSSGVTAGAEVGGHEGAPKGTVSANDSSGTAHGGGFTGGSSAEQEHDAQNFEAVVAFHIDISGGWEDGSILTGVRVAAALGSFGMSEVGRAAGTAAGEAITGVEEKRHWSGEALFTYLVSVPTEVCTKV